MANNPIIHIKPRELDDRITYLLVLGSSPDAQGNKIGIEGKIVAPDGWGAKAEIPFKSSISAEDVLKAYINSGSYDEAMLLIYRSLIQLTKDVKRVNETQILQETDLYLSRSNASSNLENCVIKGMEAFAEIYSKTKYGMYINHILNLWSNLTNTVGYKSLLAKQGWTLGQELQEEVFEKCDKHPKLIPVLAKINELVNAVFEFPGGRIASHYKIDPLLAQASGWKDIRRY